MILQNIFHAAFIRCLQSAVFSHLFAADVIDEECPYIVNLSCYSHCPHASYTEFDSIRQTDSCGFIHPPVCVIPEILIAVFRILNDISGIVILSVGCKAIRLFADVRIFNRREPDWCFLSGRRIGTRFLRYKIAESVVIEFLFVTQSVRYRRDVLSIRSICRLNRNRIVARIAYSRRWLIRLWQAVRYWNLPQLLPFSVLICP